MFSNTVILEDDIPKWDCCFNCVFVDTIRDRYVCRLKWFIDKYFHKKKARFRDPKFMVKKDDSCEHLINRPKFGVELYGDKVILYHPQNRGVKQFSLTGKFKSEYLPKLREIQEKYNFPYIPKIKMGFEWTSSSKNYALKRNQLIHNGETKGKLTCEYCKKKFYYDEVEVHHIMERSNGGSDTTANLIILCLICHDLETWKLVTGNSETTKELIWRKLIESRLKLWEKRLEKSKNRIKYMEHKINYYENYDIDRSREFELGRTIDKSLKEKKDYLNRLQSFQKRCQRKKVFWDKFEVKTRSWKYNKNKKIVKKRNTIDRFFK